MGYLKQEIANTFDREKQALNKRIAEIENKLMNGFDVKLLRDQNILLYKVEVLKKRVDGKFVNRREKFETFIQLK